MPSRSIKQVPGCPDIGHVSRSYRPASVKKGKKITEVHIGKCKGRHGFEVPYINFQSGSDCLAFVTMSENGLAQLVTALVEQLSDVTIATSDTLLEVIRSAKQRSDDDARAVVDCITQRHRQPVSNGELTTSMTPQEIIDHD